MAKDKKSPIFIDTRALMTKKEYAKKRSLRLSYITKLINNKTLIIRKIKELELELVYEKSPQGRMIKINPNKYTLPHKYAKEKGIKVQNVYNWIRRGTINKLSYPELNNLVLVERNFEKKKKLKQQ